MSKTPKTTALIKTRLKGFRKDNLDNMTKAEREFRGLFIMSFPGITLEPQKIIYRGNSGYLIDFYLPKYLIGIEIDGSSHNQPKQISYDIERTEYLKMKGIKILRLSNLMVKGRSAKCIEIIKKVIATRTGELKKKPRKVEAKIEGQIKITICPPYTEKDFKRDAYRDWKRNRGVGRTRKLTMIRKII